MTEWILVVMLCGRSCSPQYAEVFPTKAACEAKITDKPSIWMQPKQYCVPKTTTGEPK